MIGAEGGSRTHTTLRSTDFKSVASAIPPPRHARKGITPLHKRASNAPEKLPQIYTDKGGFEEQVN
jgi:hypothetical protein